MSKKQYDAIPQATQSPDGEARSLSSQVCGCVAGMGLVSSLVSGLWGGCREQRCLQLALMFLLEGTPYRWRW